MTDQFDMANLFKSADVGIALDQFTKSKVGIFLLRKAKEDILRGMYQMKDGDATDVKAMTEIQNRIRTAENFEVWLAEGISQGMQAEQMLHGDFDPTEMGYHEQEEE